MIWKTACGIGAGLFGLAVWGLFSDVQRWVELHGVQTMGLSGSPRNKKHYLGKLKLVGYDKPYTNAF